METAAALLGVYSTCNAFLTIAKQLGSIEHRWYNLSKDYGTQVQNLDAEINRHKHDMLNYQLPETNSTMKTLQRAEKKVQDEITEVERLEGLINSDRYCGCYGWGWWVRAKVIVIFFPERLEQTIKEVVEQIKSIPKDLEKEGTWLSELRKQDNREPFRLTIVDNKFHVPLQKTQTEVITKIKTGDHLVVLLQGGVGTGKTILARYVYMQFDESRDSEESKFKLVHFEPRCTHTNCDPTTKMLHILEKLWPTRVDDTLRKSPEKIPGVFHNFLANNSNILIILDDVSDGDFLHQMWERAQGCPGLKYLVTSQSPTVCNSLEERSWTTMKMGGVSEDEVRKILASLLGLEGRVIPEPLKVVANEVIAATDRNPLALACWAGDYQRAVDEKDVTAWWSGHADLHNVLNRQEERVVLGNERRSLWEAMKHSIESLEIRDATLIFFLMYACPKSSVLEEVLNIWWFEYVNSLRALNSLREWSSRGLVVEENAKAWRLRPLVTLYMKYVMASTETQKRKKKKSTESQTTGEKILDAMANFLGDDDPSEECSVDSKLDKSKKTKKSEKEKVAIALCGLYFDANHGDENVTKLAAQAQSASKIKDVNPAAINRRKQAVEPIIRLLGLPEHRNWTHKGQSNARKVFLAYVCEDRLDCEESHALLSLHSYAPAQLQTLEALLSILNIDEKLVLCENVGRILEALFVLVDFKAEHSSSFNEASFKLLEVILRSIFKFLRNPEKSDLQAAFALVVLAFGDEASSGRKVMKEDGAVADLVTSLISNYVNGHRSEDSRRIFETMNESGAIRVLVECLSVHNNTNTRCSAASALATLAYGNIMNNKFIIAKEALAGLAQCLSEHDKPELRKKAARVVRNLAYAKDVSIKWKIISADQVLAGLVECMYEPGQPTLQARAASAIWHLAKTEDSNLKDRLRAEYRLMTGLVSMLKQDNQENPSCQKYAEAALKALNPLAGSSFEGTQLRRHSALKL